MVRPPRLSQPRSHQGSSKSGCRGKQGQTMKKLSLKLAQSRRTVLKTLAVTAVFLVPEPMQAQLCPYKVIPDIRDHFVKEHWILSNASEVCEVFRITTPGYECSMRLQFQHGEQMVECGDFKVSWYQTDAKPLEQSFPLGRRQHPPVPELSEERKTWLAHGNSEGAEWCDACDPAKRFVELYPSRFSYIGPIETIENPHFAARFQRLDYETLGGRNRVAFTALPALRALPYVSSLGVIQGSTMC